MTALSDAELRRLIKHFDGPLMHTTVSMARELLAARKVVRAADKLTLCGDFTSEEWRVREVSLLQALEAYDKARKGGG